MHAAIAFARNAEGLGLGLGSLPRSLVRAMHNRAMSGRLGSIGRPGIFIDVCMHNTSGRE